MKQLMICRSCLKAYRIEFVGQETYSAIPLQDFAQRKLSALIGTKEIMDFAQSSEFRKFWDAPEEDGSYTISSSRMICPNWECLGTLEAGYVVEV